MQYGFVIDHRKCIGCHACTVACKSENDVPVGSFRTWVKYTEIGTFPAVKRHFAVLRCNHCTAAPCVTICPVVALHKRPDGIVDLDRDACIGCKACMQACPYDALYLNEDTGGAEKCHYCAHRVEQGLKPACEVVCPEEAIVSGDLHDPRSKIARLARLPEAVVRRPEQNTGPNVAYLGMDPVSLHPGRAREPSTYLWSERRNPPPDYPDDVAAHVALHPHATTVLDVDHKVHWGWMVSAYLVTKGIAAGAGLLAPLPGLLGATGFAAVWLPELIALVFTAITTVLLVGDLKRPTKFFRLLTRPNTKSWLVRGGQVLMGYSTVTAAILAARLVELDGLADGLRIVNLPLAVMTAIYTAFLFAQCEGRDLWQHTKILLPHLSVQAVLLGSAALLPFAGAEARGVLLGLLVLGAIVHRLLAHLEADGNHDTDNARLAASLLRRIPLWPGSRYRAFRAGLRLTTGAAAFLLLCAPVDLLAPWTALPAFAVIVVGMFWYEQAYVRAGQLPPLS
jgi:Fe-S-cluster-containing dehydrogenase component